MKKEYSLRELDTGYTIPKWVTRCEYYKNRNGFVNRRTAKYTYEEAKKQAQNWAKEYGGKYRIYKGKELIEEI